MAKFSSRFGYDPSIPKETLLEDAPEGMRIVYGNSVLAPLVYGRTQRDQENDENRPFSVFQLEQQFCNLARQEMPHFPSETTYWEDLTYLLKTSAWFYFYDFVEHVGKELKTIEEGWTDSWKINFGFDCYRNKVNSLFSDERIGWRLNDKSELFREMPKSLSDRLTSTASRLRDGFDPARGHYLKAVRYISERPIDPENAIKEITSAVESVGRVFYPAAKTLGDVATEMKKKKSCPATLVSMIEKFYAYASSEPAVRHGAPVPSTVALADAEFCLHVGVAMIRYLLERHNSLQKNPATSF
jgi:hypothetical protein